MISEELLGMLRCPQTRQTLALASAETVAKLEAVRAAGRLRDQAGRVSSEPIEAGLIRADGVLFFPIRAGIPVLIAEEALPLGECR